MNTLPVFLKLDDAPCLVIGSGSGALAKARLLIASGACVRLASATPLDSDTLADLGQLEPGTLEVHPCDSIETLIPSMRLVIADAETEADAERFSAWAKAARVPINVIDRPAYSDFLFGAIIDRAPITVSISTNGTAPTLARNLRQLLEAALPQNLGHLALFGDRLRERVKQRIPDFAARRHFWNWLFDGPAAQAVLHGNEEDAARQVEDHLSRLDTKNGVGTIYVLETTPKSVDHLSRRAARLLVRTDALVFDAATPAFLLDRARRDIERIRLPNDTPDAGRLLLALSRSGKNVIRLHGPDDTPRHPEIAFLKANGVRVECLWR